MCFHLRNAEKCARLRVTNAKRLSLCRATRNSNAVSFNDWRKKGKKCRHRLCWKWKVDCCWHRSEKNALCRSPAMQSLYLFSRHSLCECWCPFPIKLVDVPLSCIYLFCSSNFSLRTCSCLAYHSVQRSILLRVTFNLFALTIAVTQVYLNVLN